jgi:hypothetical protein
MYTNFSELKSAIFDNPYKSINRYDLYYAPIIANANGISWVSKKRVKALLSNGINVYKPLKIYSQHQSFSNALNKFIKREKSKNFFNQLKILGAINMYRSISSEQLACLINKKKINNLYSKAIDELFALNILQVGLAHQTFGKNINLFFLSPLGSASFTNAFYKYISPALKTSEYFSMLGNTFYQYHNLSDRHNVLAVEFLLRASEFLFSKVSYAYGEAYALLGEIIEGKSPLKSRYYEKRADGFMVLKNGKKVLLELSSSLRTITIEKIKTYLSLSEKYPDFCVLYLYAPKLSMNKNIKVHMGKIFRKIALSHSTHACKNIKFVSWNEYFPASKTVSNDFLDFKAYSFNKKSKDFDFEPILTLTEDYSFNLKNGLDTAYGCPYWQRKDMPDLDSFFAETDEVQEMLEK